tara:strand:- start:1299 stop:2069 length:771 start_codon:yes stop_codon:yes gene_type:complete
MTSIQLKDPVRKITYEDIDNFEGEIKFPTRPNGNIYQSCMIEAMNNDSIRLKKHDHFKNNLNSCFVETGTFVGYGVLAALREGCKDIHSIEMQEEIFEDTAQLLMTGLTLLNYKNMEIETYATKDFFSIVLDQDTRISLYRGDSSAILPLLLQRIDSTATLWLDAHYSGPGTGKTMVDGKIVWPIFDELNALKTHEVKDHTIMIDDIAEFKKIYPSGIDKLKKIIYSINENYKITEKPKPGFINNETFLLAKVEKN